MIIQIESASGWHTELSKDYRDKLKAAGVMTEMYTQTLKDPKGKIYEEPITILQDFTWSLIPAIMKATGGGIIIGEPGNYNQYVQIKIYDSYVE